MSTGHLSGPLPHARILFGVVFVAALPVASYATGETVGAFRMFTDLTEYRLTLDVVSPQGRRNVPLSRLAPHLGRDARRVILPAARGFVGETNSELLAAGLEDLGRLVCALEADASSVELLLHRRRAEGPMPPRREHVACD